MWSPEMRPAITLPTPIPMANPVKSNPERVSATWRISLPSRTQCQLEQRADKPEPGDAQHGESERAAATQFPDAGDDFAKGFQRKGSRRPAGGNFRDVQAEKCSGDGDSEHDESQRSGSFFQCSKSAEPKLVPTTIATKVVSSSRPLAREICSRADGFGQDAIFRRAEKRGLRGQQKKHHEQQVQAAGGEGGDRP